MKYEKIFKEIWEAKSVPKDIKSITFATSIRWMGYGVVEPLIPVFLFSLAKTYTGTGLLGSIYDIFFIISLPVIGLFADLISPKTLLIIGAFIYPFIGFFYFLAGATKLLLLVILARGLNGLAYSFDNVGKETYFRLNARRYFLGTALGYFDTVTSFFWLITVFLSILLVKILPIHVLFLAIIPTSLLAAFLLLFLKTGKAELLFTENSSKRIKLNFIRSLRGANKWTKPLRFFLFLAFLGGFLGVIGDFIMPIIAYENGANLIHIIFLSAILTIPSLFSFFIGKVADRYKVKAIFVGVVIQATLIIILAFYTTYFAIFLMVFGLSVANSLMYLAIAICTSTIVDKDHYGQMSTLIIFFESIGGLIAPVIIGIFIDYVGQQHTFLIIGTFLFLVAVSLIINNIDRVNQPALD